MVETEERGHEERGHEERRAAPLIQPPQLRTAEERSASRLELFFDLAYVLVVAELAVTFAEDLTWHGAAVFAGLFTITWWSWVTMTLYANRFDTNDVIYRLAKLGGALAVLGMAASATDAAGAKAPMFALCYLATRVVLLALYARAFRHVTEARATIAIYLGGTGAAAVLWAVSLPVPGAARYVLWAAGILVEAVAPVLATRFGGQVPLHVEHLPERFGLFVILVLGESIASLVAGVHDTDWKTASVVTGLIGFLGVAALWWNYFDLGGAAGKRRLVDDGDDQESGVADAYLYGHLPLTLGLAVLAVGLERFVAHPANTELSTGDRWAPAAGVVLFLVGTVAVIAGTSGRWRAAWPWPVVTVPVVVLVGAVGTYSDAPPAVQLGALAAVLVATVLVGVRQQRRGRIETAET